MKRCPNCGYNEYIPREEINRRIKAGIDAAENVGRPRRANYLRVYELRAQGMSIQKIADKLGVSRGAIQHALRTKLAGEK